MSKMHFVFTLIILVLFNGTCFSLESKGLSKSGSWFSYSHLERSEINTGGGSIIFDNFIYKDNLMVGERSRRRTLQLKEGKKKGRAEDYFYDQSGKYDITINYFDGARNYSFVTLLINDKLIWRIELGVSDSYLIKEKTIEGIDIQKWSKITVLFEGGKGEKCQIINLRMERKGPFLGKAISLPKPFDLNVFETYKDKMKGRTNFSEFVSNNIEILKKKREEQLQKLKSPRDWTKWQNEIRNNLEMYFGKFPEKTPLNPQIVGRIEYPDYIIEKIIFESQPNYYVTANLYIPKHRELPCPGVLFTCGHTEFGKTGESYQMTCIGLVKKGYVVLSFDPIGQGERSEYFDSGTKNPTMDMEVSQHHYVGRPAFLTGWTLSGLRTWDAERALDYLVSRPEVDTGKIASVGQSGGGQMALLITAFDPRIKVCAASHPGGSMESTYLNGNQTFVKDDLQSLIPPRPLRIIVGAESGEAPEHKRKLDEMKRLYNGFRAGDLSADLVVVPGGHTMNRLNREAVYEWLNKWFDKEIEGKAEDTSIHPEIKERLWCTESGITLVSFGGESGQSLNYKRIGQIYKKEKNLNKLEKKVRNRIGLQIEESPLDFKSNLIDLLTYKNLTIEKLTIENEKGILLPSLLIKPNDVSDNAPVFIYSSDKGKPKQIEDSEIPFILAENGYIVLAIDVRGIGETSPTGDYFSNKFTGYTPLRWTNDVLAIQSTTFGRTTLGMRTLDVLRAIDFIDSRKDLENRKIITVGEGLGGLWSLLAAIYNPRVQSVVTIGTLASYKLLISNKYYFPNDYFWVPGALYDFDISDLPRLLGHRRQLWINPVNAQGEAMDFDVVSEIINPEKSSQIDILKSKKEFLKRLVEFFPK